MAEPEGQDKEARLDAIVLQFIEARTRGETPDLKGLIEQHPDLEQEICRRVASFGQVDSLFDLVKQADEDDFTIQQAVRSQIGDQISGFKIIEAIGQGGMGIVYKAEDTRLDRWVAIKTISAHLLKDETTKARFRREAKLLAALNHPHIAAIHDIVEVDDGLCHLVLEYIPGQTLTERMANKPLKVKEALRIGQQVADALAAAHDRGVIHRDLKPSNIKITPDGNVKILDFGIAKAFGPSCEDQETAVTQAGRILGTPAYMSPEQTRGKNVDHRTDVWSFGCVLYRMLTDSAAFEGETIPDTIASVLEREPDWQAIPQDVPHNIRVMLRRCLEKDPKRRLQHIGDAVVEINETLDLPAIAPPITTASPGMQQPVAGLRHLVAGVICLALGVIIAGIVFWLLDRQTSSSPGPIRSFVISPETRLPDEALALRALAFSPDGARLAYIEIGTDRRRRVYVREMDEIKAKPLVGTDGAVSPFFSPDGRWIGYADSFRGEIRKVSVEGGEPIAVCRCSNFRGASWGPDGQIVFSRHDKGLWSISDSGEGLSQLTVPDVNAGEAGHQWPQVLPDGESVLFTCVRNATLDQYRCEIYSLSTGERRILFQGGSDARYVPTGHILYAREDLLFAVPVVLDRASSVGTSVPVLPNVAISDHWSSQFSVADDGSLAYIPISASGTRRLEPVLINREGQITRLSVTPRDYHSIEISPDGSKVAFDIWNGHYSDIWMYDLSRNALTPLTNDHTSAYPIWQPDGENLLFRSPPGTLTRLSWDGSGSPEKLLEDLDVDLSFRPTCCSPDGKQLLATMRDPDRPELGHDIWAFSLGEASGTGATAIVQREHNQRHGMWSPDGRWIAYSSEETGRWEVFVEAYPGPGRRIPISTEGGYNPLWSKRGDELYYRIDERVVAVTLETEPDIRVLESKTLFEGRFESCLYCKMYNVTPEGEFLMIRNPTASSPAGINIVLNWFEELKRLVPIDGNQ